MADVPLIEDEKMGPVQKFINKKSLEKKASMTRKRNQIQDIVPRMGRMESGAVRGLRGLRFLDRTTTGKEGDVWKVVGKHFNQHAVDDRMFKDKFGECIDSKEFAAELFKALARRRNISTENGINKELRAFWEDMTNHDLDTRLHLFFDMCDKNGDGNPSSSSSSTIYMDSKLLDIVMIKVLVMSASANKLSKFKQQAATYASLIMEELDPDHHGFIEMWQLQALLRGMVTSDEGKRCIEKTHSLARTMIPKQYRTTVSKFVSKNFEKVYENRKRIWVLTLWFCINLALFTWKFKQYQLRGSFHVISYCVCIAKGAAETLKFNMALILLPVCR
ncbi:respiratory burst oxidase homolog H [Olea europaea subsp. europaea]|uniref:Respiratory burst oxidase homolog H n=1 Tax=Olea europaea subsp. europaea TaxID=158383 RepID=A0A8S0SUC8_OLEEU|nr:respiratory burst oxidase homolog H [Olea europaea subsp. europaea]